MEGLVPSAAGVLLARQTDNVAGGNSTGEQFLNLIGNGFSNEFATTTFLAALTTSLPLTAALALVFCFLRPYNNVVYAPRARHADSKHAPPPISPGLFGWVAAVARTSEADIVERVGLDAAIFMRFCRMLRNMFTVLTVVGCGILIPVNILGANEKPSGSNSFFLRLTPQYMYGSQAFWAFVVVAYIFDIIVCYFLWTNYRAVTRLRRNYLDSSEYQRSLHARTLLVTDIKKELRSDDGLVKIADDVKGTHDVPLAAIARNVKDLPDLVEEHEEVVRHLESVLAKYLRNPNKLPEHRPTCKASKKDKAYSKGQKVDAIEYLTSRIKELELEIKEVRESVDKRNALSYGFASYENIPEAHSVAYVARKGGPHGTIIRLAPRPNDLVWKNLAMSKKERNWQNFINNLWVALLTIVWVVPNVMISVFASDLQHIGILWPQFGQELQRHQTFWSFVQAVLSPAITTLFYFYLPAIFRKLCISAGDVTKTSRERHVMHKLYSFFVFNNLIVFSIFSAVFGFVAAVVYSSTHGENAWQAITQQHAFADIVRTLCTISPYWISWLLQRNLGAAIDLSQLWTLAWSWYSRRFRSPTPRELIELTAPQPFDYAGYYTYFLFYATVALALAPLQPLVLPVVALYFWMDSYLKKYLVLYIFITKYESGGMFWRTLYNRVLFLTLLGNVVIALVVVAQGAIGANWGMLAALAPLPFLIGAFKWYCAHAFDDQIHYYQKGKTLKNIEAAGDTEHKRRKGDRVGVRFGHPVLYKPLITPMVSAKSQHLLKSIYSGRLSMDEHANVAGYSDVYMNPMEPTNPGKALANAPFEFVSDAELDFEHFKDRPEFRDEAGGDGQLFGHAQDVIRPGTPGSTITRAGTMDSSYNDRSRSESRDSERTRVGDAHDAAGVEYPRGYHQTPSALREQSPTGSEYSGTADIGTSRGRFGQRAGHYEGLVANAARMGRSPPPLPLQQQQQSLPSPYAPSPGGYGPVKGFAETPGETPGEEQTSYDYFRRGRGL